MVALLKQLDSEPNHDPVDLQEREADLARCGALKDFWYVACLSSELGVERPLARTVFGVAIAFFRDARGHARAVRDRCLHRATALSRGVVVKGALCCPYHGWAYDGAGRCVSIPSMGPDSACDVDRARCLPSYPTREQDGLVYVFLGGPETRVRQAPFRVPHIDESDWCTYFMVTRFPMGVTQLVENFMDVPHTIFVHEGWFRVASGRQVPTTVERRGGGVHVTYHQTSDRISGLGFALNPQGDAMVHTDRFFIPNITRVDYAFGRRSGFVITSQCTPVHATETLVYTAISYRLPFDVGRRLVGKLVEPVVHWYTRQVINQDVRIMEAQKEGWLSGPEAVRFSPTPADAVHHNIEAYRRWLLEGGEGDGPGDSIEQLTFWA